MASGSGITPPNGYKLSIPSATPAANYDDMFESPADSTAEGVPTWIKGAVGTPETKVHATPSVAMNDGTQASAYVEPGNTRTINVQNSGYNSVMAAHEATHLFQNSRNADFTNNLKAMLPNGVPNAKAYDYGGIAGLMKNHPSIGHLNAEQQATIVGNLTTQQSLLRQNMSPQELANWDQTKNVLERSIEQLKRIPPKEQATRLTQLDNWLSTKGITGKPLQHLRNLISPDKIDVRPMPVPGAPSVALGYANPSNYVTGGEFALPQSKVLPLQQVKAMAANLSPHKKSPKKTLKELKEQVAKLAPITPPKGYVLSAYTPSTLQQIRNTVANSAIGHSIEQTMPKIADMLNMHPSETVNSPTYAQHKDQLLAPEYATKAIADQSPIPLTQSGKERLEGALRGIGGITSGKSMATMAGTAVGAGLTAGVVNPASAQVLSRLVSGGFSLDMLHGLYQQSKEYRKAVDSGNMAEAHKIQGEMGVTGIMALLTGHHALGKHPVPAVAEEPFHEEAPSVAQEAPPISTNTTPEPSKPVNKKVQTDANQFKAAIAAPVTNEEGLAIPSVDVDVKFPPPKEMEAAWRDASTNQELHAQFKRTGINGFSIEEPYKFGLSEQGNIDPKTGKIAINAAASNPTHTLAHEVAHDIYNRLTPENRAEIDRYVGGAEHIYPDHGGGLEERVMDHFADEISKPMSASAPSYFRKIFFDSPLEPRPEPIDRPISEVAAVEPKRPIYGTWSNVALSGGYLRTGDEIRGLVEKDGDFPLVLKDTYGARHVMPASIAVDVLDSPAHNYVREVFMAKDHVHDDATSKLEKDLSDKKKMLAANSFMSHEMVDGKLVNEPDPKKPLHDRYRKELEADVPKIEKILADRKAGVPHKPVPTFAKDAVHTQPSGARMLTDAIETFANQAKLKEAYKSPELSSAGLTSDRRVDTAERKRVEHMTPEEMRKALLTSDKTGIPNRRAFDDAEHVSPSAAVGMSDADGLKALNDKFGYAAGDAPSVAPMASPISGEVTPAGKPSQNTFKAYEDFMERVGTRLAREEYGQGILDDMDEKGESPADISKQFWNKTYFDMPAEAQTVMQKQIKALTGMEPGSTLAVGRNGEIIPARDWAHIADGLVGDKVEYLEGGERGYVAMMRDAIDRFKAPDKPALPTEDEPLPSSIQPDRRVDTAERKRVEHMTPEEMRKALLTSDKTGIPNRRAFDDAEHVSPSAAVGMSDADGLKALNDKFGYAAGDELLKAKAEALRAAGLDAYHEKGDEFLYRGASPQDLKEKLDKARQMLRDRTIEVTLKDGTKLHFKGADFSFGTGKDLDESESGLKQHKDEREARGERSRGELRGITQVKPE